MLETLKRYLRYTSWPILAAMAALMVMGILAIRESGQSDPALRGLVSRQIVYACVALGACVAATMVPYRLFGRAAYVLFAGTLALLVLVLFLPPIRRSHRWIDLKLFLVQPSEIAKLAYIMLLAWHLRRGENYRRLRGLIVPFVLTFVPMGLILIEPDLGTSLLFVPTLYFMLFMAGGKLRHLLGVVAVATVLLFLPVPRKLPGAMTDRQVADRRALAYGSFQRGRETYVVTPAPLALIRHQHQFDRIDGWLRQGQRAIRADKGFQLFLSKLTLGAGGATGRSERGQIDLYFRMLPDDHTDFIFSVIGGRWGFFGCTAVLVLYGVIFVFGIEIAAITHDAFGRLLAVGVLAMLFSQVVINVGMTMGLMPITGMTLPLVSYGGSSLVVNGAALGLLINVGQRQPILLSRRPFEHGRKREKPPAPYGPLAESPELYR